MKKKSFIARSAAILLGITLGFGALSAGAFKSEPVKATETTGTVSSATVDTVGDINGDGEINAKDVTMLRRHLAGGWGVTVNEEDADINGDGEVNAKDVTMLRRYLAGGWGVELPVKNDISTEINGYWEFTSDPRFARFVIPFTNEEGKKVREIKINCQGEMIESHYDESGKVISKISYELDTDSILKRKEESEKEDIHEYEYYPNGSLAKETITDQYGYKNTVEFDENGKKTLSSFENSDWAIQTEYSYNERGLESKIVIRNLLYGTITSEDVIEYEYDSNDKITKKTTTDNQGKTTTQIVSYDGLGRIVTGFDGDNTFSSYEYDELDRVASKTNERGEKTEYLYDSQDRIICETITYGTEAEYISVTKVEYSYYDNGGINSKVQTSFSYGEKRILREEYNIDGTLKKESNETRYSDNSFSLSETEYLPTGKIERKKGYSSEIINEYEYNLEGALIRVNDKARQYDSKGRIIRDIVVTGYDKDKIYEAIIEYPEDEPVIKATVCYDYETYVYCYNYRTHLISLENMDDFGIIRDTQYDDEWNLVRLYYTYKGGDCISVTLEYENWEAVKLIYDSDWSGVYTYTKDGAEAGINRILTHRYVYEFDENGKKVRETRLDSNCAITDVYNSDGTTNKLIYHYGGNEGGKDRSYCEVFYEDNQVKTAVFVDKTGREWEINYIYDEEGREIVFPDASDSYGDELEVEEREYDEDGNYTRIKTTKIDGIRGVVEEFYYVKGSSYDVDKVVLTDANGITREYDCVYDSDGNELVSVGYYEHDWDEENAQEGDIVIYIYEYERNEQGKCVKETIKKINHRTGKTTIYRVDEYD